MAAVTTIDDIRHANLLRLIDETKSVKAVADAVGVSQAQISQLKNRSPHSKTGVRRAVGDGMARRLEQAFKKPRGWMDQVHPAVPVALPPSLLTRTGDPNVSTAWQDAPERLRFPAARAIPVVGTAQLGDNGHYVELDYPVGNGDGAVWYVSDDANAYAVRCQGDSMYPRLQHGEFAVIEPNHPVNPGDEVLVRALDDRVMIKRLRYVRDGRVYLDSVNAADHPPIVLNLAEIAAMHYVAAIAKSAYYRPG